MLLSYIPMEDQDADILKKALTRRKFEYHKGKQKKSTTKRHDLGFDSGDESIDSTSSSNSHNETQSEK